MTEQGACLGPLLAPKFPSVAMLALRRGCAGRRRWLVLPWHLSTRATAA